MLHLPRLPIESVKLDLLDHARRNVRAVSKQSDRSELRVEIGGVTVGIQLLGLNGPKSVRYLRRYLSSFVTDCQDPMVGLQLYAFENEFAHPYHPMWNQPADHSWLVDDRVDVTGRETGFHHFIDRNFVCLLSPDRKAAFAVGPRVGPLSNDLTDNLLRTLVTPRLLERDALMLHSAAVVYRERAYVFFGPSGAGKSTLALQSHRMQGCRVVGSDQNILHIRDGVLHACATHVNIPEFPKGHPALHTDSVPVAGVIQLGPKGERGFTPTGPKEILSGFLKEVGDPPDSRECFYKRGGLDLSIRMLSQPGLKLGRLSYPRGESFWPLIESVEF